MRRLLVALAAVLLPAPALAQAGPAPSNPADWAATDWQFSDKSGASVEISFLPQGKALITYNKTDWAATWTVSGQQVTIASPRGGARFTTDGAKLVGTMSLAGADRPITAVDYRGKVDLDRQVFAEQLTYSPCEWINQAVRVTARKTVLINWAMNGMAFAMQGYDNAKRSERNNRLIVARAGKGRSFGGIKGPYLAFHKMLESCPIRVDGKLYPLEGLVRLKKDGESSADQVYSYFRLRGATGNLGEIEIVIYGDWYSRTPFAVLDIGTGDSAFPNHSSSTVKHDFPKGWQPFGVQK